MKVVILCGGQGTRLREETEYVPKPLIRVGDKPILWHIMKLYSHYGFNDFVLCLGYKGNMIKNYFIDYETENNDFTVELGTKNVTLHGAQGEKGWKVTLVGTGQNTMTGARLKLAERYIDGDTFMLTYGDGVTDLNISELVKYHKAHGKIGTVTGVRPSSRFGELIVDGGMVKEFSEKPQVKKGIVNGGFFVFNREIFDYLGDDCSCILEREPLEELTKNSELAVFTHEGFWQCMDTLRDLKFLNNLWAGEEVEQELHFKSYHRGGPPWKVWND